MQYLVLVEDELAEEQVDEIVDLFQMEDREGESDGSGDDSDAAAGSADDGDDGTNGNDKGNRKKKAHIFQSVRWDLMLFITPPV